MLRSEPKDGQSVNQTTFSSLHSRPIAINVESKVLFSGGETEDILAIQIVAGFTRL